MDNYNINTFYLSTNSGCVEAIFLTANSSSTARLGHSLLLGVAARAVRRLWDRTSIVHVPATVVK